MRHYSRQVKRFKLSNGFSRKRKKIGTNSQGVRMLQLRKRQGLLKRFNKSKSQTNNSPLIDWINKSELLEGSQRNGSAKLRTGKEVAWISIFQSIQSVIWLSLYQNP